MLNFPNAPADGEISAQPNGVKYQWNDTLSRWDSLSSKLPAVAGTVVQVVNITDGALQTGTTILPWNNTIPQITEGDEYMSFGFTPKYATSVLKIDVVGLWSHNVVSNFVMALFQDAGADAIGTMANSIVATRPFHLAFTTFIAASNTDPRTFTVRAGSEAAGTTNFNGNNQVPEMGGSIQSSITITEIQPNAVIPEPLPPGITLRAMIAGPTGLFLDVAGSLDCARCFRLQVGNFEATANLLEELVK